MVVELTVNRRSVDFHVRVHPAQCGNAFGAGQQAEKFDGLWFQRLDPGNCGYRRVAGGQHGVDHDDVTLLGVLGHLEVVLDRLQGFRVAVQANVANARARHHCQHAVQNSGAGTQNGYQYQFLAVNHFGGHGLQRCFDFDILCRHVARYFVGHQHAQFVKQGAKAAGAGILPAHQGQFVLHQRVVDQVDVLAAAVWLAHIGLSQKVQSMR